MRQTVIVLILSLAGTLAAQQAVPKELVPLQGSWTLKSINGEDAAARGIAGDITITGDKYVVTINGTVDERGTVKIDASKKPMLIDLSISEGPGDSSNKLQLGLMEIDGDTIRFHMAAPGNPKRPLNFDPIPDHDVIVVTKKK
jgi:uncharacterized protein (TIGR03067 family)